MQHDFITIEISRVLVNFNSTKTPRFDDKDISLICIPVPFKSDTR